MAADIDNRLSAIESKARVLVERYKAVVEERDNLAEQVKFLTEENTNARKTIETLNTKLEYMKVASTILPTADDIDHSRQFLSRLVWEIDQCIARLSD